jgi:rubredoxin
VIIKVMGRWLHRTTADWRCPMCGSNSLSVRGRDDEDWKFGLYCKVCGWE